MEARFRRVRDLFGKRGVIYKVPEYQRGFEWEKKNFEDLWTDLERIGGRVDKHYLGNIILLDTDGGQTFEIVDGQQRMVTISILLMAIRDSDGIADSSDRRIDEVLNSYPDNNRTRRLRLYDDESDSYFDALWKGNSDGIDGNIGQAYQYFQNSVDKLSEQEIDTLISKIVEDLRVVETTSRDSSLAYMIFQSQNERGMEVSPEVLIKARIFGEADRLDSPRKQQEVKGRWQEMCRTFESNLKRPRFQSDYTVRRPITHILLNSEAPTPTEIEKRALYRNFDEVLQSHDDVVDFVRWFDEQSKVYMDITSNHYDVDTRDVSQETRRYIQYFNSASTHAEVLSLAILNAAEDDAHLKEYFRLAAILPMRMAMAGYRSQDRKSAIHVAARRIRRGGEIRSVLREVISEEGPTDPEIIETLKGNKRVVRGPWRFRTLLQLISIEEQRRGPLRVEPDHLEIEHIAPRNTFENGRYSEWRRVLNKDEFEEEKNKLGNLTLLDGREHAGIDEKSFDRKKRVYANSDLRLTEEVGNKERWTEDDIKSRTERLATELTEKWSI